MEIAGWSLNCFKLVRLGFSPVTLENRKKAIIPIKKAVEKSFKKILPLDFDFERA